MLEKSTRYKIFKAFICKIRRWYRRKWASTRAGYFFYCAGYINTFQVLGSANEPRYSLKFSVGRSSRTCGAILSGPLATLASSCTSRKAGQSHNVFEPRISRRVLILLRCRTFQSRSRFSFVCLSSFFAESVPRFEIILNLSKYVLILSNPEKYETWPIQVS